MTFIVDYGMGNLLSVKNALDHLGEPNEIVDHASDLIKADRLILPGIGGFPNCSHYLYTKGFVPVLNELVIDKKIPILGICLGMQVMAAVGKEFKSSPGLGWFNAEVIKMEFGAGFEHIKIPNIGWENISFNAKSPLFKGVGRSLDFYLVHSYYMKMADTDMDCIDATYTLGDLEVTAAVRKNNIFGTQFHPERSSDVGLAVLDNFLNWN